MMFLGQVFLITPFAQTYFFYFYSYFLAISTSVLFWMVRNISLPYAYLYYAVIMGVLIGVPLIVHLKTRKSLGTIQIIPAYSIFFLGLLIVLSTSGIVSNTITTSSLSKLYFVTILLFVITSVLGLNNAYRTLILNKKLRINNRNTFLLKTKEGLKTKYKGEDEQADIDLLTYYLSSSIDSFVYGDFDRSFMDAFKIIDNQGTAFARIYVLKIGETEWKRLRDIRNNLSHAKISGDKEDLEEGQLKALKDLKKNLFQETLNLLIKVRFDFIDKALEKSDKS
jgi:hypothetical protein